MTDKHGDFGYEKGSTWHRIMTSGTPAEKKALDKWLDGVAADARAMEGWARGGASAEPEAAERDAAPAGFASEYEVLTPDVDAYLKKRGYDPDGASDDE